MTTQVWWFRDHVAPSHVQGSSSSDVRITAHLDHDDHWWATLTKKVHPEEVTTDVATMAQVAMVDFLVDSLLRAGYPPAPPLTSDFPRQSHPVPARMAHSTCAPIAVDGNWTLARQVEFGPLTIHICVVGMTWVVTCHPTGLLVALDRMSQFT